MSAASIVYMFPGVCNESAIKTKKNGWYLTVLLSQCLGFLILKISNFFILPLSLLVSNEVLLALGFSTIERSAIVYKQQITPLESTQWCLIQQKRADLLWKEGELSDALGWCCHGKLLVKKASFSRQATHCVWCTCVCGLCSHICELFCEKGRLETQSTDVLWSSSDPDQTVTSPSTQGMLRNKMFCC